jgi:cytochrome c oxidase cbb3-type subunit 4
MTYEAAAKLAQQGGSVYFLLIFLAGLAYALWPKNRDAFDKAARQPFDEDMNHDASA